jgi:hypothetical protein
MTAERAPKFTPPERPWALEVWEDSIINGTDWRIWSTYQGRASAQDRALKLMRKGYDARVIDTRTGEIVYAGTVAGPSDDTCDFCDESHPAPHDGGCLL